MRLVRRGRAASRVFRIGSLAMLAVWSCSPWGASSADAQAPRRLFVFRDAGDEAEVFPHVAGIAGHGAAWGDIDGDGWPELYVGAFGGDPYKSKTNQLLRNRHGRFVLDDQSAPRVKGRANGAVFADLDNDGDLDLYTTNHAIAARSPERAHFSEPNHLFRNDGGGRLVDVGAESGACPQGNAARSVTTLDFDGDGRLDLLVGECFFQGGKSRSRLYRNLGDLKFEDATAAAGLPEQVTGFGVAAGDVNGDGRPDLFLAGRHHGNRLFLNGGEGRFREAAHNEVFAWDTYKDGDDTSCGVCLADVNVDGRLDIVLGSHFAHPWSVGGIPVRLYLNAGAADGEPGFVDVTAESGLPPLPMKSPHVEVQDFDNDGMPDLYTTIVKFADGEPHPLIFRNVGARGGAPRFVESTLGVNDFPNADDLAIKGSGPFFDRMIKEHKIIYSAPGPSADYDRDGRLDLFLPNWWVEDRSLLLHNETPGGHWLEVTLTGPAGVNRQGVGARVRVYAAGRLGDDSALVGNREIAIGFGYASGQEAVAHFGLGTTERVDLEVVWPHGRGRLERRDLAVDRRLTLE